MAEIEGRSRRKPLTNLNYIIQFCSIIIMSFRPNRRLNPLTLYSTKQEIRTYYQSLTQVHLCINCDRDFDLLTSMGKLECTQHPGYLQTNGRYSCCGLRETPLRYRKNIDITGLYPAYNDFGYLNGYCVRNKQPIPTRRRGCQKCDCSTSSKPWKHKDRVHISELAPLIPIINNEMETNKNTKLLQREGFDNGYLRRCEIIKLQKPAVIWDMMRYESIEGKEIMQGVQQPLPSYGTLIGVEVRNQKVENIIK